MPETSPKFELAELEHAHNSIKKGRPWLWIALIVVAILVGISYGLSGNASYLWLAAIVIIALILYEGIGEYVDYKIRKMTYQMKTTPTSKTVFCRHCGKSIPINSTYCEHCGRQLH